MLNRSLRNALPEVSIHCPPRPARFVDNRLNRGRHPNSHFADEAEGEPSFMAQA